jgi:hypothetical protein
VGGPGSDDRAGEGEQGGIGPDGAAGIGQAGGDGGDNGGGGSSGSGGSSGGGGGDNDGDTTPMITGYQVVSAEVTLAAGGYARRSATCPAGKVVLSGGVTDSHGGGVKTVIRESGPVAGDSGTSSWTAAISNEDGTDRNIQIVAVCADPPPGYEIRRREGTLSPGGDVTFTGAHQFRCVNGTVGLGGGVLVPGRRNYGTAIRRSFPTTLQGWFAHIGMPDGKQERTVVGLLVCADPPAGYHHRASEYLMAAGADIEVSTACDPGTVVLGGGAHAMVFTGSNLNKATFDTVIRQSTPTYSATSGSQWRVRILNTGPDTLEVTAQAVCAIVG